MTSLAAFTSLGIHTTRAHKIGVLFHTHLPRRAVFIRTSRDRGGGQDERMCAQRKVGPGEAGSDPSDVRVEVAKNCAYACAGVEAGWGGEMNPPGVGVEVVEYARLLVRRRRLAPAVGVEGPHLERDEREREERGRERDKREREIRERER